MRGNHLRFYTYENRRHDGTLLYEWLLARARELGIHGGSAFRAIAGYGRHGRLHEQQFFELAGEVPILIEFLLSDEEVEKLFAALHEENIDLFYARLGADYSTTEAQAT